MASPAPAPSSGNESGGRSVVAPEHAHHHLQGEIRLPGGCHEAESKPRPGLPPLRLPRRGRTTAGRPLPTTSQPATRQLGVRRRHALAPPQTQNHAPQRLPHPRRRPHGTRPGPGMRTSRRLPRRYSNRRRLPHRLAGHQIPPTQTHHDRPLPPSAPSASNTSPTNTSTSSYEPSSPQAADRSPYAAASPPSPARSTTPSANADSPTTPPATPPSHSPTAPNVHAGPSNRPPPSSATATRSTTRSPSY
jgi:hypothetical protein